MPLFKWMKAGSSKAKGNSPAHNNPTPRFSIYLSMKIFLYAMLALILAAPFATPANAQIVIVDHGHRHHRHYHHRHYRHHYHR